MMTGCFVSFLYDQNVSLHICLDILTTQLFMVNSYVTQTLGNEDVVVHFIP